MIVCEACKKDDSSVVESRRVGKTIRRRRRCTCGNRWTTFEVSSTFLSYAVEVSTFTSDIHQRGLDLKQMAEDYGVGEHDVPATIGGRKKKWR